MAIYPTGITRTIQFSGTLTGDYKLYQHLLPFPLPPVNYYNNPLFDLIAWGYARAGPNLVAFHQYRSGASTAYNHVDVAIDVGDGSPATNTFTGGPYTGVPRPDVGNIVPQAGSWSITAVVELCFEVYEWLTTYVDPDTGEPTDTDEHGFPNHGGSPQPDGPPALGIRWFERLVEGEDITAYVDSGDATGTVTKTVPSGYALEIPYGLHVTLLHAAQYNNESAGITVQFDGENLKADSYVHAYGNVTIDASSSGVSSAITANAMIHYGSFDGIFYPPLRASLLGRLRQMTEDYDGSVDADYGVRGDLSETLTLAPWDSADIVQRAWDVESDIDDASDDSDAVNEVGPIRAALNGSSLASADEDSRDWRVLFAGRRFDACELVHQSVTIEDGSSYADWTNGANTVGSSSGGAIVLVVSGGIGSASRAYDPKKVLEGARYLRVRIKSTGANKPFRVVVGGKTYAGQTGSAGTYSNVDIDLCAPISAGENLDDDDSRWPLDSDDYPVDNGGDYWGVSWTDTLQFKNLEDGQTYSIDSVSLIESDSVDVSMLSAFLAWRGLNEDGSTEAKRFLLADVDGKVGAECYDMSRASDGSSYAWQSLSDLFDQIGMIPNFDLTPQSTFDDGFHTLDGLAYWLGGAGAIRDYATPEWVEWLERSCETALVIQAQSLWDEIYIGVPHCGAVPWEGGSWPGVSSDWPLPIAFSKTLRGQAWGLVMDGTPEPLDAQTVDLRALPADTLVDDGDSDTLGRYKTSPVFGHGYHAHRVRLDAADDPHKDFEAGDWYARKRHRVCFANLTAPGPVGYDVNAAQLHWRAYISGRAAMVGWAQNVLPRSWTDVNSAIVCDTLTLKLDRWSRDSRLYLAYSDENIVYLRTSTDGRAWSEAVTIGTGDMPAIAISPSGARFVYWINGSDVKGKVYDQLGNVIVAEFTATSGVDDQGLAADWSVGDKGDFRVGLLCVKSGSVTYLTAADGKTFS